MFDTKEKREAERQYILSINPVKPGKTFNHDPACFAEYCRMQLKDFMQYDNGSFSWYYNDIQQAINIAERSIKQ